MSLELCRLCKRDTPFARSTFLREKTNLCAEGKTGAIKKETGCIILPSRSVNVKHYVIDYYQILLSLFCYIIYRKQNSITEQIFLYL